MAMSGRASGSTPSEIECRQIAELLGDYFDGTLPRHTVELLEWHIDGCAPCVAFINTYRTTIAVTRKLPEGAIDRKSTRLNSSHVAISYAVVCLKKKTGRWPR